MIFSQQQMPDMPLLLIKGAINSSKKHRILLIKLDQHGSLSLIEY